jgi:hypothetical protein
MKKITINYTGTGIKTLQGVAIFILILGIIATVISFIGCFKRDFFDSEFMWEMLPSVLIIFISTILSYSICMVISTIAKNSIIAREQRKALLEKQEIELEFIEPIKKNDWL